jgi:hypothetical protein
MEAMIVESANEVCHEAGVGASGNPVFGSSKGLYDQLGIGDEQKKELVKNLQEEYDELERFLGILN